VVVGCGGVTGCVVVVLCGVGVVVVVDFDGDGNVEVLGCVVVVGVVGGVVEGVVVEGVVVDGVVVEGVVVEAGAEFGGMVVVSGCGIGAAGAGFTGGSTFISTVGAFSTGSATAAGIGAVVPPVASAMIASNATANSPPMITRLGSRPSSAALLSCHSRGAIGNAVGSRANVPTAAIPIGPDGRSTTGYTAEIGPDGRSTIRIGGGIVPVRDTAGIEPEGAFGGGSGV